MNVIPHIEPTLATLELFGRFDAHVAPRFETWVEKNIPITFLSVIVSLSQVTFIDSKALAALVRAREQIMQNGGRLILCDLQQPVRIIFELTQFDQVFELYPDYDTALEKIAHESPAG
ncbi:MAG TPA: STAS domain-containing protein [Anaerolineales bacterium]|nr:STAS domain-containing protein [Anaerolineales bacterium]